MSNRLEQIITDLSALTLLEAAELSKMLEEKWGVSAASAAPVMMAAGPAAAAVAEEAQTEFDVILTGFDAAKKLEVIKTVRTIDSGLSLGQAKELVEGAPKTVKSAVSKADSDNFKKLLEAAGATVKVQ